MPDLLYCLWTVVVYSPVYPPNTAPWARILKHLLEAEKLTLWKE